MSIYAPYISSGATSEGDLPGFWQRYLKSDGSTITISVALDKNAIGGETVTWASDGDAVEGIHWTTTSAKTVTLITGQKSFDVLITPKESGKWYRERTTKLRLSATGLRVHQEQGFVHLVFSSSAIPPLLVLTGPASAPSNANPVTLTVTASYPPQDSIVLYAEVDASSAIDNYTINGLGSVVIAASASNKIGTFTITKISGSSGLGDMIVNLVYERRGIAFVEHDYDTSLNTFTVPRNTHLDQNLWHQSNDIGFLGFNNEPSNPVRPHTPGHPNSHEGGGSTAAKPDDGQGKGYATFQDATPRLLDPITGNELKLYHVGPNIVSGISYLREGFDVSYTGGNVTAHLIRPYTMTRYYFTEMISVDAGRNSEFRQIHVRHRNNDRNHSIVFRFSNKIDSTWDGTTANQDGWLKRRDGSLAVVAGRGGYDHSYTFASGLRCWEYSKSNGHEDSNDGWGTWYGAGEDSNGTYIWYQHRCDGAQSYATTAVGSEAAHGGSDAGSLSDKGWWKIVPGKSYPNPADPTVPIYREYSTADTAPAYQPTSSGLPIIYPIWSSSVDGSNNVKTDATASDAGPFTNRLGYIRANGIGCLIHSMQFSMSNSQIPAPNATTGRFWPCEKSVWDPQGLAVIEDSGTAHKHTVNITGR
jgi:hypothetical protein